MKRLLMFVIFLLFLSHVAIAASSVAYRIDITGFINPIMARYISMTIEKANKDGAEFILAVMDTPGGLMESTRVIVKAFLSSKVPIVVYVYPKGARAASAGTFIAAASNVIAMTPGTTIGAAHPVSLTGGTKDKDIKAKIVNYLAGYIRAIAQDRKRPARWFEEAVRKSSTLTSEEAMKKGVIDMIAAGIPSLLDKLDGYPVKIDGKTVVIHTKGVEIKEVSMKITERILHAIGNPNIAYILLLLAFYGIIFELASPGAIVPGVIGSIALILFLFSLQIIPINYSGLSLIILGAILFIVDLKVPSHGILSAGGVISMLLGSFMLIGGKKTPMVKISTGLIIGMVGATAAFFIFAVTIALVAQRRKVSSGKEGMVGEEGKVIETLNPEGIVSSHGERWKAISATGESIEPGSKVRIKEVKGLTLIVEKVSSDKGGEKDV